MSPAMLTPPPATILMRLEGMTGSNSLKGYECPSWWRIIRKRGRRRMVRDIEEWCFEA